MRATIKTWSAESWTARSVGFFSRVREIQGPQGQTLRSDRRGDVTADGVATHFIARRGLCLRLHSIRDRSGSLLATALPLGGCRSGYAIVVRGMGRFVLERRHGGGWLPGPISLWSGALPLAQIVETGVFGARVQLESAMRLEPGLAVFLDHMAAALRESEQAAHASTFAIAT